MTIIEKQNTTCILYVQSMRNILLYIHMLWPAFSCNYLSLHIISYMGCRGQTAPSCTTSLLSGGDVMVFLNTIGIFSTYFFNFFLAVVRLTLSPPTLEIRLSTYYGYILLPSTMDAVLLINALRNLSTFYRMFPERSLTAHWAKRAYTHPHHPTLNKDVRTPQ